ncbi:MAG: hypothetical protein JXR51_10045 [Bacteroidales bacterium]|nr:hypothetical protein [Bacteroidales bacterium]MBN2757507.1 hypothetical protein [Bacteroidales bacterium]
MIKKGKIKIEWIIISILLFVIITGLLVLFEVKNNNKNVPEIKEVSTKFKKSDNIIQKYEKLELAYNITINEIENVVGDESINLAILKENLVQILEDIKKEKAKINIGNLDSNEHNSDIKTNQLQDLLSMSKDVLAERMLEINKENRKLTIDNRKLHFNLKKSVDNFEIEKKKNMKLNEEVSEIKIKIKKIEEDGISSSNELKLLKREKNEVERRLVESNKTINTQNEQIQELGEIIRKVNVDCYFYYEKGNPMEEATIYLTSQGISEKYVKYFVRKKPDIYIEFKMSADMIVDREKLELKMFNSLNVEIYSVFKLIDSEFLRIIIPNKNFDPGKYSIELKSGEEDLILDKRYWFKIGS